MLHICVKVGIALVSYFNMNSLQMYITTKETLKHGKFCYNKTGSPTKYNGKYVNVSNINGTEEYQNNR